MHAAADRLLHGASEGLVGGGDRQEEVFGAHLPLRRKAFVHPRLAFSVVLLLSSRLGGGQRMKEGDAGRGEEAAGGRLFGSCGKVEEVLQGDGTPSS